MVAERLDDVIGRDGDVRGAAVDHAEHRRQHAANGADLAAVSIPRGWQRVIVAEQFVGAVDQVEAFFRMRPQVYPTGPLSLDQCAVNFAPLRCVSLDGDLKRAM